MVKDCINEEDKVGDSFPAQVEEMEAGNGIPVHDGGFKTVKEFLAL